MVTISVESGDLVASTSPAIILALTEGSPVIGVAHAVDAALGGALSKLIAAGDIKGKTGEITTVHTFDRIPSPRVVVAGLGRAEKVTLDTVRDTTANVARALRRAGIGSATAAIAGAEIGGLEVVACARAMAEGATLGLYTFTRHKSKQDSDVRFERLTLMVPPGAEVEAPRRAAARGVTIAAAVDFARDMENEPSNHMTPSEMAARARAAADEVGLECIVLDREEMVELGMGGMLGVAQGSHQPPKFIVLHYRGDPATDHAIGLVGKGITFDTGGISIKPAQGMEEMKGDMSGAASVIATLKALGALRPKINVTGIACCTENMPGGGAIKPGDVLRAMNGKTMEVVNTDAEGRLVLSDGLSYARRLELSPIVDIATLTGAISVALGNVAMGVMSNDDALVGQLRQAAARAGEKIWQLPMYEEYKEQIKSDVADVKNTGGRLAGSITAAWFLQEFAEGAPWAHIDMAGVDNYDRDKGVIVKGASGIPVRTLIEFVLLLAGE